MFKLYSMPTAYCFHSTSVEEAFLALCITGRSVVLYIANTAIPISCRTLLRLCLHVACTYKYYIEIVGC